MAETDDNQPPYPAVRVQLDEITDLRRTVSHLHRLHEQHGVILADLSTLVGRLPDWEDVDE